ncbi:MAG: hypothetical protein ACYDHC_05960 [Desulfuromonadaceae bacterium]
MSEGISILEEIKKGGYEASLIITYNAYLPFYEEVVLRHLTSQGVRHNILMMDASQASQSINTHPPHLAGLFYTLIPMKALGAFHPKIILLVGKNKGCLFVGSHNLTLSGFGYNRELTNMIKVTSPEDTEAVAVLQSAWHQILLWVKSQGGAIPQHIVEMVSRIPDFAPWIKEQPAVQPKDCIVISTQSGAPSLWNQLKEYITGKVESIIVTGAFFDSEFEFIKKLDAELNPKEYFVGTDPETVQMPTVNIPAGVKFVNCKGINLKEKDDHKKEVKAGYLHAKAVVFKMEGGRYVLAIGSANPSSPAWLQDGTSGNVEAMLIRTGEEAEDVAREIGLLDIPSMPKLEKHDWQTVSNNWQAREKEVKAESTTVRVALAVDEGFCIDIRKGDSDKKIQCDVLGPEMVLLLSCDATMNNGKYFAQVATEVLQSARFIRFKLADVSYLCVLQHQKRIEENSRTGTQRRFRDALASLSTGSPDLETLIRCVDKIIFDKAGEVNRIAETARARQAANESQVHDSSQIGGSLSVDVSDTKKTKKKFRLRQSDDLAYLLDVLIYHLRLEVQAGLDTTLEARDSKGRTEEEQVGAEDDDGKRENGLSEEEMATKTLDLCHTKIRTLISRMIGQLDRVATGENSLADIIVKLTAVLAVIRQLRNCDGKVSWIKKGQTSVPVEQRKKLFSGIVRNLFEAPHSIIYPSQELDDADELARLKGLTLWLAWDSGIRVEKKKPYIEPVEDRNERVRNNSIMVALAQLVKGDDVVKDEAKKSIGPMSSSDMGWLKWVLLADKSLNEIVANVDMLKVASNWNEGELALNAARPDLGVRMILGQDATKTTLSYFSAGKDHIAYLSSVLKSTPFDLLSK